MTIIQSEYLNDGFQSIISGLSTQNKTPSGTKNLVFSFDLVPLIAGGPYQTNIDDENFSQIFRIYDDMQVIGIMTDIWGLDRPQMSSNDTPFPTGGVPTGVEISEALSFRLKILGNYTKLDDEKGYPAIYKSTEFNLVNDFLISFGDGESFTPHASQNIGVWDFGPNYMSNEAYVGTDLSPKRMPPRQMFFPLKEDAGTQMLHGGAEYIITLDPFGDNGKIAVDGNDQPAYHMTTSIQVTLVCRCFRRRFS